MIVVGIVIGSVISLAGLAALVYFRVPILGDDPVTVLGVALVIAGFGAFAVKTAVTRSKLIRARKDDFSGPWWWELTSGNAHDA